MSRCGRKPKVWLYTKTVFTREQGAQFDLSFELRYFGPCVRQLHRDASFEMCNSNDGPEVFSSYADLSIHAAKSVYECLDL